MLMYFDVQNFSGASICGEQGNYLNNSTGERESGKGFLEKVFFAIILWIYMDTIASFDLFLVLDHVLTRRLPHNSISLNYFA